MKNTYKLKIGWLYPDLMSTYGDRGNVQVLTERATWNGISTTVLPIDQKTSLAEIKTVDFIFGGGSQDTQQELVMRDLKGTKAEILKDLVERSVPALFVCGAPQIMGTYYEPAVGKRIDGLGIFDMYSVNPGPNKPRCIGNIIAETNLTGLPLTIVGFENHGGRSYLGKSVRPFAKVLHGFGNNGEDKTEGVIYKNAVGCYFHGPLLPKNPTIGDYLLKKALEVKYSVEVEIKATETILEKKARSIIMERYSR